MTRAMPNLFVIGAPKCGTTALCSYLQDHPQVFVCATKEPHFYSSDLLGGFPGSRDDYLALFEPALDTHRWRVDGSTAYLRSACAIDNILADQPDARFIAMLRNPVEMAFSLHAERIRHFDEDVMSFRDALDLEPLRAAGQCVPRECPEPKLLQYRWFCMLGEQVDHAMQRIPAGRLHLVFHDDFERSPMREYRRVLEFLGLPGDGRTEFPRINARRRFRWPALELGLRAIRRGRQRLGLTRGLGIHRLVNRYNLVPEAPRLPPDIRHELAAHFAADVALLERLVGRDLHHWLEA